MALSKDTPGPRGRPKAPPKRPKDDLGELWQVLKIIEKPVVFIVFPGMGDPWVTLERLWFVLWGRWVLFGGHWAVLRSPRALL